MRARQAASGFFGAILFGASAFAPVLVAHKATAKIVETRRQVSPPRGHAIVQAVAENVPAPPASAADPEHSEGNLHVELEEGPAAGSASSEAKPARPPSPKPSAPVTSAGDAAAPRSVDVADLKQALATRIEALPICRRPGGPEGPGIAEVTFSGDGRARVGLSEPYASTPVGACIARRLAGAAATFDGEPVTLRVRFDL